MAAEPVTRSIDGFSVSSTPLPPMRAIDLIPEVASLMDDAAELETNAAMFFQIAKKLGQGRARELLPRILAGTKITVTENGAPIPITLNTVETFDLAFDGRMGLIIPVIAMALEVSFKDFFAGLARIAKDFREKAKAQPAR